MTNEQIVQAAREAGYFAKIHAGAVVIWHRSLHVSIINIVEELGLPVSATTPSVTLPYLGVWVRGSDSFEASKPAYGLDWAEHMALQGDVDDSMAAQQAGTGRE